MSAKCPSKNGVPLKKKKVIHSAQNSNKHLSGFSFLNLDIHCNSNSADFF